MEDSKQLAYYNSGIGTYAKPSWKSVNYFMQVVDNSIDLAIAWRESSNFDYLGHLLINPGVGILKRSSSAPIVGSLITTKRMIEFFYSVSLN